MFEVIDVVQGSDEWLRARYGLITASSFDRLITKTGRESSQLQKVVNECVAEMILGGKDDGFQSDAMIRGNSLEHEALEFFNCSYNYDFEKVGFLRACQKHKGENVLLPYGCSPDGVDFKKQAGIELKCPLSHTHVGYLVEEKLPDEYKAQVQGSLMVSGFEKWIFGSYHPELPPLSLTVYRDEKYINALKSYIDKACEKILTRYEKLKGICEQEG